MPHLQLGAAAAAAVAAGFVNALAGGGTLITFPALIALGLPPVAANVTSTVALCPGYLGATLAQRADLSGQGRRLAWLVPSAALGGAAGGLLLLRTGDASLKRLIPWLLLLAVALLGAQEPLRGWLSRRAADGRPEHAAFAVAPIAAAAVYGGYFGAGVSVVVLAVLGLVLDDALVRLTALKQALAFALNVSAAVLFVLSGEVAWTVALVMAAGALGGGVLGGRLAGKVSPAVLRGIVMAVGLAVAAVHLVAGARG